MTTLATDRRALFHEICRAANWTPEPRRDEYIVPACLKCGKTSRRGDVHCHVTAARGYHCFYCNYHVSLSALAKMGGIGANAPAAPPALPKRTPDWRRSWRAWLDHYAQPLDLVQRWQAYKPVSIDSIARFRLGFGKLPGGSSRCHHRRLIVPVTWDGEAVALRGRRIDAECGDAPCPKWIAAAGSRTIPFGADRLGVGAWSVVIVENPVDAILWEQMVNADPERPFVTAIAILSASAWRDEWADLIAARPRRVVEVALDNDLAGQATGAMRDQLLEEWHKTNPSITPPSFGFRIRDRLLARGLPAHCLEWSDDAPPKADPYWLIKDYV